MTYSPLRMIIAQRERAHRQKQLQYERDNYQRQIQLENIKNLRLQNAALSSSIEAMGGRVPGQSTAVKRQSRTITATSFAPPPSSTPTPSAPAANFPSLAEIRSMIESSQQKAQEDFTGKIDLLKNQEQQKQEEEQLSARNAATRMQNYQRQSAIGAWESALRGR